MYTTVYTGSFDMTEVLPGAQVKSFPIQSSNNNESLHFFIVYFDIIYKPLISFWGRKLDAAIETLFKTCPLD